FAKNDVTVGGDVQWVDGASYDRNATTGALAILGGHQLLGGFFVQDVFSPVARLQVVLSARVDHWSSTERATGRAVDATVFDPQLGIRYQLTGHTAIRLQGYRGFRAPTLNELYRQFQLGNVLTQANATLRPERTN